MNVQFRRSFYQSPEGDGTGGAGGSGASAGDAGKASSEAGKTGDATKSTDQSKSNDADPGAGFWPADWRTKVAGADEKEAKRLERFASPADLYKQNRELEKRLSSGSLKPVLAKDATEDDIKAYRKEHGIPESHEKYDLGDLKIPDHDKEFMGELLKVAHASHQKPEQIKPLIKAFFDLTAKHTEKVAEQDKAYAKQAEDELRNEWGQDFRRHTNLINGLMDLTGDPQFNESLMNGRLADGTMIKDSPAMQKFLLQLALINNPAGVVVPSHNGNPSQGVDDRIAEIEGVMRKDRKAYNSNIKMQEELRNLYTARENLKQRKAA